MIVFRIFLFPLTILYGFIVLLRLICYQIGIFSRTEFDTPVICIGNLTVGGTGKTPHTEWILRTFRNEIKLAVLSRGYKRKTTGYKFASVVSGPEEIGDEPFQLKQKFKDIPLAVAENRVLGLPELLGDAPETELVIMDDGFQHLALKAKGYILLTDFNNLYTNDWLLPSGLLREFRFTARRAHIIIVTKCPEKLTEGSRVKIIKDIQPNENQKVLFSSIKYDLPVNVATGEYVEFSKDTEVIAISGLANARLFERYIDRNFKLVEHLNFRDHHEYTQQDIQHIMQAFEKITSKNKILLCTEKDAGKLRSLNPAPEHLYYLPITIKFQKDGEEYLSHYIRKMVQKSKH